MKARPILLALMSTAVLAGCGSAAPGAPVAAGGANSSAAASSEFGAAEGAVPSAGAAANAGAAGLTMPHAPSSPGSSSTAVNQADLVLGSPGAGVARSVTATYTVPHGDFLSCFDTVIGAGVALGGYVVSSSTSPDAQGRIVSGQVTLAVPAAQMASLLDSLPASEFTPASINFASVDHTSDLRDVNARLTSAQAHLTALQKLLAGATSLDAITTLEQQIEDVETSIDTDQDQLTSLDQSVAFATVTVRLRERGAVTVAVAPAGPSVTSGISKGWTTAVEITTVGLQVLVTAIPFAILALVAWIAWWRFRGRAGARRAKATV